MRPNACLLAASILTATSLAQPTSSSPLAPPANGPRRADPTWVALAGCTLHPKPGEVVEGATVVFRDGLITAILPGEPGEGGKFKPARLPLGPRVIDCKGLHVYAAFIDACVEVDAPAPHGDESQLHWNKRVTPQRSALDGGGIDEGTASSLRKIGFGAAIITPKGGIFRGRAAAVSLAKSADDTSAGKPLVYKDDVYQSVALDTSGGGYPDSQMGAIAVVRQTFGDADWQAQSRVSGALTGPWTAVDFLAPAGAATDKAPPHPATYLFNTDNELDAFRVHKIAAEFSRPIILLGCGTEFRRLEALKKDNDRFILPLNFPKAPDVGTIAKQEAAELRDMMTWEQAPTNLRRVRDAGLAFALTTAKLRDRGEFLKNVRTAIKHGLKEDEALAALTTTPATWFLSTGSTPVGVVAVGARANLLVTDGPVFGKTSDNKESKIRSVWIDGTFNEITAPSVSYEGTWDVSIPADDRPVKRRFEIGKDNEIEVYRDDKHVKSTKVDAAPGRLTFVFDHDALDSKEGLCTIAALVSNADNGEPATMTGIGITGTGRRFDLIATKRPKSLAGIWPATSNQPDQATAVLVFNKDGQLTIRGVQAPQGAEPKAIAPQNLAWDGSHLRYEIDQTKIGGQGITTVEATVDWAKTPPEMSGVSKAADGKQTAWKALRRDGNPFVGSWRVTEADGVAKDAAAKEQLTIKVGSDSVTLTFAKAEGDPTVIKCDDVKFAGLPQGDDFKDAPELALTFTHDLTKLGGQGKSSDVVKINFSAESGDKDSLTGVGTLPDASRHTYRAEHPDGKKSKDDDDAPTDVPEKLNLPFGPYGLDEAPEQPANLIISNATIWTNGKAGKIDNGFVYVRAGKIVQVGAGAPNVAVPQGEKSSYVDAKGKHVTAGIIDCHSHTGISGGVNEGGQAVTAECRIEDVTNPDAIGWYQQLAGGVTMVNNLHGSANAIGGQSQTNKVRWGCLHPDDMHFEHAVPGIKFALGENPRRANRGPQRDFGGGEEGRYPASRMGVEMLIRDRFTAAKEYAAAKSTGVAPRRDLELEPLAEILAGKRLVHCHSYRQDEMLMLAMVAKDCGFKIGTYQHALEGYKVADYVRDYSGGASGFSDWWAYKVEVQDAIPLAFPIMHEQGVVVSFNSDSNELARRLNTEAAKAVKYGNVPEQEALKFVTLNPARQLKVDSFVGSIEEGKDADLVIWSGTPLSAFSRCEATFVDGRRLFSLETDAAAREKIRTERSRLIQKLLNDGKKKTDVKDADKPKDGAEPRSEDRPAGRRRRPPNSEEEIQAQAVREYFIQLHNSGIWHEQGVCGCYDIGAARE